MFLCEVCGGRRVTSTRKLHVTTIIDCRNRYDAVVLLQTIVKKMTTDELITHLIKLYTEFPPSPTTVAAMSFEVTCTQGSGNIYEYASSLVLYSMTSSLKLSILSKR